MWERRNHPSVTKLQFSILSKKRSRGLPCTGERQLPKNYTSCKAVGSGACIGSELSWEIQKLQSKALMVDLQLACCGTHHFSLVVAVRLPTLWNGLEFTEVHDSDSLILQSSTLLLTPFSCLQVSPTENHRSLLLNNGTCSQMNVFEQRGVRWLCDPSRASVLANSVLNKLVKLIQHSDSRS